MGDLAADTTVEKVGPGRYQAKMSGDWEVWGAPNGAYLASICLRATGLETAMPRPVSISCSFLRPPGWDVVDIDLTRLGGGRRIEYWGVALSQHDKAILHATVGVALDDLPGPEKRWRDRPDAPEPSAVPTFSERTGGRPLPARLLENFEIRPVYWINHPDGSPREAGESLCRGWNRLLAGDPSGSDVWLDACRALVIMDMSVFPAFTHGFPSSEVNFVASTVDLYASFDESATDQDWLLADAVGLLAHGGMLRGDMAVWAADGRLVASGTQLMLTRRMG